eukprot:2282332-Rhodomonas_salina.1
MDVVRGEVQLLRERLRLSHEVPSSYLHACTPTYKAYVQSGSCCPAPTCLAVLVPTCLYAYLQRHARTCTDTEGQNRHTHTDLHAH